MAGHSRSMHLLIDLMIIRFRFVLNVVVLNRLNHLKIVLPGITSSGFQPYFWPSSFSQYHMPMGETFIVLL